MLDSMFDLSVHLYPYFMYASSKGSGNCAFAQAYLSLRCSTKPKVRISHVLIGDAIDSSHIAELLTESSFEK